MRLLLVTFVLDELHPALAWQVSVARELASKVDQLYVLTSHIGQVSNLPDNVEIIVPPVRPMGIPHRFGGRWAFNRDMYRMCREKLIDAVFVHMAMEWAYILYPTYRALNLPVVMWYAHGSVTKRLKLAIGCVDRVVTSTPEGCRVASQKVNVIGQAVNTAHFKLPDKRELSNILYIGRISQRKRVDLLYSISKELGKMMNDFEAPCFDIVGAPLNEQDMKYEQGIRTRVWQEYMDKKFRMYGIVPYARLPEFYETAFLHINVSETGSMDKTVMEALSCGCPVLTSNAAFFDLLSDYPEFLITDDRPEAIAEQVRHIYIQRENYKPLELRSMVQQGHDLDSYADRIMQSIEDVKKL